LGICI